MTVPPTGWYVEIDDPQSGHTWTPDVAGDPNINPGANDYPKITVPVRRNSRWLDPRYEEAPMRVWRDGDRQPIDQLEEVVEFEDGLRLIGRGGVELDTRVQVEIDQKAAHTAAEDIIQNNTPYAANVDTPDAETRENEVVQEASTESEFSNTLLAIPETTPVSINSDGTVDPDPVCFFGENETFGSSGSVVSDSDASNGEARLYSIGGDTLNFNLDYKIPSDKAHVAIRYRIPEGQTQAAFDLQIDGTVVDSVISGVFSNTSYDWFSSQSLSSPLSPGSHTASIELGSSGEDIVVDALVVYDDQYSFTFDNTVDADGYLSGPESKPEFVEIETDDGLTVFQFTGARFEAVYDDTAGNQRVGVSNDQGASFTYADNSETVETDFASGSAQIRGSLGFDRYGSRSTQSPTTGFKGQTVSSITLKGDIEETALLINQDYDARAIEVLQDIANYADLPFEYRKEGGTPSVEMSKPGQRTTSDVPTPSKYEYSKTVEEQVGRVVVKGGRQQQREEEFTADYGTAVSLEHGNIDHGTETVYEPSTGESFEEGADYSLSPGVETDTGSITTLSGGSMSDGTNYAIDYNYHEEGTWTDPSAGPDPKPLIETIPGLTTQRSCEQAAVILGRQLDEPLEKATVTIPTAEAGFNILDAQQISQLPSDTFWDIQSITTTPRQTEFNLGSRKRIGDAVNSIKRRLSSAAKRT